MNKSLIAAAISAIFIFSLSPLKSYAWSDLGHSIIGAVAEENINEKTRDYIRGLLGIEPLSAAAVWPDHVRDDMRFGHKEQNPEDQINDIYDFGNYHFCEIPNGFSYDTKPKKDAKDCYGVISHSIEMLKDTSGKYTKEMKIIAMRYLVHVLGDIHQPLHIGNGHDKGGNTCVVYWRTKQRTYNFHSFWDETIVQYLGDTYSKIGDNKPAIYANQFITKMKIARPEMFQLEAKKQAFSGTPKDWLSETQKIRESGVYPSALQAGTQQTPKPLASSVSVGSEDGTGLKYPYCVWYDDMEAGKLAPGSPSWTGAIPKENIPLLDETYGNTMAPIVETALLKGGLRLAATLDDIASTVASSAHPEPTITKSIEDQILQTIQDAFKNK